MGIVLLLSTMSKVWERAVPWHVAQGFDEVAPTGAKTIRAMTIKAAVSKRYAA